MQGAIVQQVNLVLEDGATLKLCRQTNTPVKTIHGKASPSNLGPPQHTSGQGGFLGGAWVPCDFGETE